MAKILNRLTARTVETIKGAGLHADGGGLYLSTSGGGRRWVYIYRWGGKRREMGLGSARTVSLARARELAADARQQVADGRDPIASRNAHRAVQEQRSAASPEAVTFGLFAEEYIASVEDGWRSEIHRRQWRSSLTEHAAVLNSKSLGEISTDDLLDVLRPIWLAKPETAGRVRARIEKILAAAKARGLRAQDSANPAQWRGHLELLLPKQPRLVRGHHSAMPYSDLPQFMAELATRPAIAARALEFLIFNASRTGEVLGARWGEIEGDLWSVPACRMKGGLPHTVTLSGSARQVLSTLTKGKTDDFVFTGARGNTCLSNMSMTMLLRRMNRDSITVHGFRSAFKDWAVDCTDFADEVSEEALAHLVGSSVRRAYRRGEALDRRRRLMEAWATFLTTPPTKGASK